VTDFAKAVAIVALATLAHVVLMLLLGPHR